MSETTALSKSGQPPGPLVDSDAGTHDLLAPGDASEAGRLLGMTGKVALWVAAFTGFLVLFQLSTGWAMGAALAAFAALLFGAFGWNAWSWHRMLRQGNELNLLAERGQLDQVVTAQHAIVRRTTPPLWRRVAVHDLGYYELRRGNVERALAILSAVYRTAPAERGGEHLRAAAGRNLSVAYLASGDVDAAAAWVPGPSAPGLAVPEAAAAVCARRGEWDRVLEFEWPVVSPRFAKALRHARRMFFLMRAFARDQRGDSDPAALADDLEAARPAYAGEFDYLTPQWPELGAFIAQHCLPPRSAPDAEGLPPARTVRVR